MNPLALFELWVPPSTVWSRWAKPVLFADIGPTPPSAINAEPLPSLDLPAAFDLAIVLDLPSAEAVKTGLAFAQCGYRPVPLFNGARGPQALDIGSSEIIDNAPILAWLTAGAEVLARCKLAGDAPPVFLLDSRRLAAGLTISPGRFDNRWIVLPQDFPSASFLRSQKIARALVIQIDTQQRPQEDLAHVLRRWQEAGLALSVATPQTTANPEPLTVQRPRRFRSLWYTTLAVMGLRRNSAGGFGSIVPQPSSG